MSAKIIEEAFQRHPRPQWPTKATLLEVSRNATKSKRNNTESITQSHSQITVHQASPWKSVDRLGELVQAGKGHTICVRQGRLVMVKSIEKEKGNSLSDKLHLLNHPNLLNIATIFYDGPTTYLELEYSRYTLEEILNVHLRLEEAHIQLIASSVFSGLKHLAAAGLVHRNLSISTVRIRARSAEIIITELENTVWQTQDLTSNVDLEQLGIILLQCMNGRPSRDLQDISLIREARRSNKMFGLEHGEKWIGFKLLVDFLDEVMNEAKPAIAKFDRPHKYVGVTPDLSSLEPFLELAPLECFALWRPEAQT